MLCPVLIKICSKLLVLHVLQVDGYHCFSFPAHFVFVNKLIGKKRLPVTIFHVQTMDI